MQAFRQTIEEAPAVISISIPVYLRNHRVEILILPMEDESSANPMKEDKEDKWRPGFFDATFGSSPDFPPRESPGDYEHREEL